MFLDNDGTPVGGGGDKPERVEVVAPHVGVLLQLTPRLKLFNVGLSCCAKDATGDEVLGKFRSIFHEDDKVKWTEVVREAGTATRTTTVCSPSAATLTPTDFTWSYWLL